MNPLRTNPQSSLGKLALLAAIGALLAGCSDKSTYVLVHGAFQGAWAWEKVTPLLENEGHEVVTVELPGHGADTTPFAQASLQGYTDKVAQALDAQDGPVILVGHSMGGLVVSQAAEARPDKVQKLVYLAAYMVKDGETLLQHAQEDAESNLGANLIFENGGATARVKPEALVATFCQDCSQADADKLRSRDVVEPTAPLGTPIKVTEANWGRVPRVYIETTQDRTVGPALQKRLYTATPVEQVLTLDAGHSPFLSQPDALAKHLLSL